MLASTHTFSVWHPSQGLPLLFEEKEFGFSSPVSRIEARRLVEKVEGFVIAKSFVREKVGSYIHKPRPRVQKI